MPIDVPNECLTRLGQQDAVNLVYEIIYADAAASNIPPSAISFSTEISAKDGGMDGKVCDAPEKSVAGTIKKGTTCYQIKSGKKFFRQEVEKTLRPNGKDLSQEIRRCLDGNDTLVFVLTGIDTPAHNKEKIIRECLPPEYEESSIEVWNQTRLRTFLKRHPRLALRVLGIGDELFCTYQDWARQPDMRNTAVLGPDQEAFNEELRQRLKNASMEHIRVTGDPGIGKTRLVLEALKPADLADSCLYVDNPRKFLDSGLFRHLISEDDRTYVILVVDECSESEMVEIWNRVERYSSRIKLVTIYNEPGERMGGMVPLSAPPLGDEQITQILGSYGVPPHLVGAWCEECRPSPRAAHIIGKNLRDNPDDVLQQPGTVRVWDRYIASNDKLDGTEFNVRKVILCWISLFKKFGYGAPYSREGKIIAKMLEEKEGIPEGEFTRKINDLRQMRILQGSSILYITPKVLHAWLWREWGRKYAGMEPFSLDDMAERSESDIACRNVLVWYLETPRYGEGAPDASHAAKDLFRPGGFADRNALLDTDRGASLFYMASKADPAGAVDYLDRHIKSKGRNRPIISSTGRRQAAMVLADAAMDQRLFQRSARMLLWLAGTEDGRAYGDAGRMFVSLFPPASGPVARTEMPPSGRVPLIAEALGSDRAKCRLLGIQACKAALQTGDFIRSVGEDEVWRRSTPWMPKYRSEYTDYYLSVMGIVREYLGRLGELERTQLAEAALARTRKLLAFPELRDELLSILDVMYSMGYADSESIIKTISDCLAYGRDGMAKELQEKMERLHDKVAGNDYGALLRRYVAMNIQSDHLTENETRQKAITTLARQSLDMEILGPELDWLVTNKAVHGYEFGCALGEIDDGASFHQIYNVQKRHGESNAVFLGGYLRAVFHRDIGGWERLLDFLGRDDILRHRVPALTHMSGMTDRAAIRIRDLIKSGLSPLVLRDFTYGTSVNGISEKIFEEWLRLLAGGSIETYEVALNLYHTYYIHGKRRIPDSARLLLFPQEDPDRVRRIHGTAYVWARILASYIKQNPDATDVIISDVINMVIPDTAHRMVDDNLLPALEAVMKHDPVKSWGIIVNLVDPDKKQSASTLLGVKHLFTVNETLVDRLPLESICGWIDRDAKKRAPSIAYLLPADIKTAVKFMALYGNIPKVRKVLIAGMELGLANSPRPSPADEIRAVDSLVDGETNAVVLEFLEEYRRILS